MYEPKGIMDGWHGDEPEIEAEISQQRAWIWEQEPEDEWDDRRRREMVSRPSVNVSNFDLLNKHFENLKKTYGGK